MRNRLFLIDGASYAYRSFYAIRHLSTSKGVPTNAVYGFVNTINKLIADFNPEYLIVTFDAKGPTFRHERFKEYKIQRKPMPEELAIQLPQIKKLCKALGIPVLEQQGYEADDLMATLAEQAAAQGLEVYIATGDKDMLQIVDDDIKVLHTHRDNAIIDVAAVREKYGIEPGQIVDMLALAGDTSDNVPGIPGIGEKTALSLIQEFKNVQGVLDNVDKISGAKRKENIRNNAALAQMSRELVTLDKQAPVQLDLDKARAGEQDSGELENLYREFEFNRLLKTLAPEKKRTVEYKTAQTDQQLHQVEHHLKTTKNSALSLAVADDDPITSELIGFALSPETGRAFYLPLRGRAKKDPTLAILKKLVSSAKIQLAGHNIKQSIIILRKSGLEITNQLFDVEIAAYLLQPEGNYQIETLAQKYLETTPQHLPKLAQTNKKKVKLTELPLELIAKSNCEKADLILELMQELNRELTDKDMADLFHQVEMPLVRVLADMEYRGVRVDTEFLADMSAEFKQQLDRLELRIYDIAGGAFNINSPKQLAEILFTRLKLPVQKRTKTGPSTDVEVLTKLARLHPLPKEILEYRQLAKLKSTYIDALPGLINPLTGRLHTSFNQTVTSTGRLSSSNPNLQNIPVRTEIGRRIRRAFVPAQPDWLLISADYSQIELRIFAHLADEENMIEAFRRGDDIHAYTASLVWQVALDQVDKQMRERAKAVNFGIIYGQQAFGLAAGLGIDVKEAADFIEQYYARYPRIKNYMDQTIEHARREGWVSTIMNRRRYIPELKSSNNNTAALARRTAINAPIQGSAADIIKVAMINIHRRLEQEKLIGRMILQIHDELVFEAPADELEELKKLAVHEMESVVELKVPLKVECNIGANWMEIK